MKLAKSKLKPVETKLTLDFEPETHPLRDLKSDFIINKLEQAMTDRKRILTDQLKLQK